MKTTVFLMFSFLSFSSSYGQLVDLTGTWTEFEMTYVSSDGTQKMTEDQMKTDGSVTEFFFLNEGKFKQTSNMSGSGTMDTYEGTWKLEGNKLNLTLNVGGRILDLVWDVEFKDNILNLSRTSPDGSLTIINTFRRK
jgi:hypothetical protein